MSYVSSMSGLRYKPRSDWLVRINGRDRRAITVSRSPVLLIIVSLSRQTWYNSHFVNCSTLPVVMVSTPPPSSFPIDLSRYIRSQIYTNRHTNTHTQWIRYCDTYFTHTVHGIKKIYKKRKKERNKKKKLEVNKNAKQIYIKNCLAPFSFCTSGCRCFFRFHRFSVTPFY